MALFIWTTALSTGNSHVDADHHELVDKVNTVLECIAHRADGSVLASAIDALAQFTREHFQNEELAMQRAEFFGAQEHAAQHAALLEELDRVMDQLHDGKPLDSMALYTRLTRWVVDHIQQYDRAFAQSESTTSPDN